MAGPDPEVFATDAVPVEGVGVGAGDASVVEPFAAGEVVPVAGVVGAGVAGTTGVVFTTGAAGGDTGAGGGGAGVAKLVVAGGSAGEPLA